MQVYCKHNLNQADLEGFDMASKSIHTEYSVATERFLLPVISHEKFLTCFPSLGVSINSRGG